MLVSGDEVDADWLTASLASAEALPSGRVTSVRAERIGTGQAADSYRLTPEYAGGAGPQTLVAKVTSTDARSARTGSYGLYEGEVRFYQELAPTLPVRTPQSYASEFDPGTGRFVLLLEDLAPAVSVDQIDGMTVDQASLALEQAAGLHSASWHDPVLAARPWLSRVRHAMLTVADALPGLGAKLSDRFADVLDPDDLTTALQLLDLINPLKSVLDTRTALWHQDFRADNLLFSARDGAVPVAVLDWQTVTFGPALADVALLLGGSLPIEERRAHELDLVRGYHAALVAGGVTSYSFDECWLDYRTSAVAGVFNGINGPVQVRRTPRGDLLWASWLHRHCAHATDLGTLDLLRAR
ncbi:phosphotransferase family protein [Aeromicrobium alkaliterrae]